MAPNAEKNENSEKTQQDSNEQTTKNKVNEFDSKFYIKSVEYLKTPLSGFFGTLLE